MPSIGITGGIASGKTTFRKLLLEKIRADLIDTDSLAHDLLRSDPAIKRVVASRISPDVFDSSGSIDRSALGEIVFNDKAKKRILEQLLHPVIRDHWTAAAIQADRSGTFLVVEIPLLFESGAEAHLDRTITVGCPRSLQFKRLTEIRKIAPDLARKILASQLSLEVKSMRSDHVVWNDGPPHFLEAQADRFADFLNSSP